MLRTQLTAALAALLSLSNAQAQIPIATQTSVVYIDVIPALSTSIVYQTAVYTILECPPDVTNCPVRAHSIAIITATTGVTTTVCPLTMTQARLSSFSTTVVPSQLTGGAVSVSTQTWPTQYTLLSSYSVAGSYSIDPSVWASLFPTGLPTTTSGVVASAAGAGAAATPMDSALSSALALFAGAGLSTIISVHDAISTLSADPSQTTEFTSGSFELVVPGGNSTTSITVFGATTLNYANATGTFASGGAGGIGGAGGAAATSGGLFGNLTVTGGAIGTIFSNFTPTGGPLPLQTVNVSPSLPINVFGLLVAFTALAFAL